MVAPNSESARANASTVPVSNPGIASGSVIVNSTRHRLAPSVPAAASSLGSTASSESLTARTSSGNAITPPATAAPCQVKGSEKPNP